MGGLGEGTGVLYLDTERKFAPERLVEIARAQAPTWYGSDDIEEMETTEARVKNLLKRTIVVAVDESKDFLDKLDNLEALVINQRIGLIIVDSIASLGRIIVFLLCFWKHKHLFLNLFHHDSPQRFS